ncbi:MAG: phospholipid carrier-dependent glycosyltransferase [Myxococcales bacterium]|nr:phospholipid carrier-dependent glycosyltransferase [Myxococcales bacterium]MCB9749780.1 phospholipid carrier-dependent glycosyltransferase [Myxococcales bacterium]
MIASASLDPPSSPAAPSWRERFVAWLWRNRWLIAIVLATLAVRLHWNLYVHPLGHYVVSDMRGYNIRAGQLLADPWGKVEYHGFFPYGTHYLLAGLKWLFGRWNYEAVSVVYALLGTTVVGLAYTLADRVSRRRWVAPALGLILVFYYPLISLGGYMLSETPFALCLLAATNYLVRLAHEGRSRHAWLAGLFVALAVTIRPQVMISAAVFGALWLVYRRGPLRRITLRHLVCLAIPVALILGYSSYRLHFHTERRGLVSENGQFNLTFGRCHARKIMSTPNDRYRSRIMFGPPPLIQLEHREKRAPGSWIQLEPSLGPELVFPGYISDKEVLGGYIRQCMRNEGVAGQLKYSVINVMLLVGYNTMWPDSGQQYWRHTATKWGRWHIYAFTFPAILALLLAFRRKNAAHEGLVAVHVWALILLAAVFFGGTRFRCPYDPFIILLALEGYGLLFDGGRFLVARARARVHALPATTTTATTEVE